MERKFSAADLVKCSARQMVYIARKKERYTSYMQMKGIQYQSKIVDDERNHGVVAEEMRGAIPMVRKMPRPVSSSVLI